MKKLHTITAAAGILLALASPTLAAQYSHRPYDAYASGDFTANDRSGAYYYGAQGGSREVLTPAQHQFAPSHGQSLPYPDRPYGDPDRW